MFLGIAASIDIDPIEDALVQRILTSFCYHLLDYVKSDWVVVAPDLLGRLRPIAESLPAGLCLADRYPEMDARSSPSPSPSPSDDDVVEVVQDEDPPIAIPPFLSDVYALRKALVEAKVVPTSCTNIIEDAGIEMSDARTDFQRKFDSPYALRDAAQRRFHTAYIAMTSEMLIAEVKLMERQANFDRLVRLLRGDSFFTNVPFDVDIGDQDLWIFSPYKAWCGSAPPAIYEMLSE
jgi:hypothetical protein